MWLLAGLSRTWIARPDKPVGIALSVFSLEGSATGLVWVGPNWTWGRTGNLQSRKPAWVPVLIFLSSPANLVVTFLLDPVYAGDKPGGIWHSPTSRLGTGGFLYPCVWPSASPPLPLQWTPWVLWTTQMAVPWIGKSDPECKISHISWNVPVLVYGSRRPWCLLRSPTPLVGGRSWWFPVSPFWIFEPWRIGLNCSDLGWVSTCCWVWVLKIASWKPQRSLMGYQIHCVSVYKLI